MGEDLPPWVGHEAEEEAPGRRTRPWVIGLAVVPWLVVLGLVLAGRVPTGPATGDDAPDAAPSPAATRERSEPPAPAAPAPSPSAGPLPPGAPADATGDDGAPTLAPAADAGGEDLAPVGALALAVARAWLTDVGPHLEVEGVEPHDDLYLEHGMVERIDRHGDHAVASLLAVVLVRDGDAYTRAVSRRVAVPIALDDPPRPAGPPWWQGEVELATSPPEPLTAVEDPELLLSASEALVAAGLGEAELLEAARTPDGWWLARLAAHEDGEDPPTTVWLRPGPHGPVVAGTGGAPAPDDDQERR